AILREANRIAQQYKPPLPIFPYTKFEYDPLNKNCSFYSDEDLCSTIIQPARMGVNGLIFWSSSRNMQTRCNAIKDFVNLKIGPYQSAKSDPDNSCPADDNIMSIVFWNVASDRCSKRKKLTLPLKQFDIVHNKGQTFYGDKIVLFYEKDFGLFPYYRNYDPKQPVNGGLPQ
ncbi:hypothetical protein TELCIR_16996, partial [Teladorsagia circumcincta]